MKEKLQKWMEKYPAIKQKKECAWEYLDSGRKQKHRRFSKNYAGASFLKR